MSVLWLARGAWFVLPFTSGHAVDEALAGWARAPAVLAGALVWAAWGLGALALLAPRPWGSTVLRVVATAAVGVTVLAAPGAGAASGAGAIAVALVAAALAVSGPVATAAANGSAYGDERRFPLRAPAAALAGLLPLTAAAFAVGVAAGPLLLADGRWLAGAAAVGTGVPVAIAAARALHGLSRRWCVLVPAGLVVADPLALADPVLCRTPQVAGVEPAEVDAPPGAADLRFGVAPGSVAIRLDEPVALARRRGRRGVDVREATTILVAPVRPRAVLDAWASRSRARRATPGA